MIIGISAYLDVPLGIFKKYVGGNAEKRRVGAEKHRENKNLCGSLRLLCGYLRYPTQYVKSNFFISFL